MVSKSQSCASHPDRNQEVRQDIGFNSAQEVDFSEVDKAGRVFREMTLTPARGLSGSIQLSRKTL
jgi:hypothetical protein